MGFQGPIVGEGGRRVPNVNLVKGLMPIVARVGGDVEPQQRLCCIRRYGTFRVELAGQAWTELSPEAFSMTLG